MRTSSESKIFGSFVVLIFIFSFSFFSFCIFLKKRLSPTGWKLFSYSFFLVNTEHNLCVKSVHIRSYSGPPFPAFGLNTDQNNSEYGHFLRSVCWSSNQKYTECWLRASFLKKVLKREFFGKVFQKPLLHLIVYILVHILIYTFNM